MHCWALPVMLAVWNRANALVVCGRRGQVFFPFHDAEDEVVAAASVRRARVYDSLTGSWSCVRPWQVIWRSER